MGAWRRFWDYLMSLGAYPHESDTQRGKRRIVVGVLVFGTILALIGAGGAAGSGLAGVVVIDLVVAFSGALALLALKLRPHWFVAIVNLVFLSLTANVVVETVMLGGMEQSELTILFGILAVLGALISLNVRAAFWWLLVFVLAIVLSAVLPNWIDPIYIVEPSTGDLATTLIGVVTLVFVTMAYFVRQRDRLQAESDELLYNILPRQIASRLKTSKRLIADHYEAASVLFVDVVGFTQMSSSLSPDELVALLSNVFTTFDGFVADLGLEKIKTVGDEYMAAGGVPAARSDHASAIADLGIRIRDYVAAHDFDGHRISVRIGINSGPVVAGVVGTHKFAYDLWGDVVNVASRMESEGVPGSIQISPATHELLRAEFLCEPRDPVTVKGKGRMQTYILQSRRANQGSTR